MMESTARREELTTDESGVIPVGAGPWALPGWRRVTGGVIIEGLVGDLLLRVRARRRPDPKWGDAEWRPPGKRIAPARTSLPASWAESYAPKPRRWWAPKWTDCGWAECPTCHRVIAAREAKRMAREEKRAARRGIYVDVDWTAEITGTGAERIEPQETPYKRPSRAKPKQEKERAVRRLDAEQRALVLAELESRPLRACYERADFISAAWLELTNPSLDVAKSEETLTLEWQIEKAADRAQSALWRAMHHEPDVVALHGGSRMTEATETDRSDEGWEARGMREGAEDDIWRTHERGEPEE
jgi:hypothetical protein